MTQGDALDFPARSRLDHGPSKDHFFNGGTKMGTFERVAEFVTSHHATNDTLKKNSYSKIPAGKEKRTLKD